MMAVTTAKPEKMKEETNSKYAIRPGTVQVLRCPIIGCFFTTYNRLELVAHLRHSHTKKSLARVVAWYSEKFGLRKIER
jgi:hypothetical protein